MDRSNYIDREVLLQVKRNYSDSEIIKLLTDVNRSLEFQIGELKSELAELKYQRPKPRALYGKDEYVKQLLDQMKRTAAKKNQYKKDAEMWRNKYFNRLHK